MKTLRDVIWRGGLEVACCSTAFCCYVVLCTETARKQLRRTSVDLLSPLAIADVDAQHVGNRVCREVESILLLILESSKV